jgi:hypothetical protein
MIRSNFRKEVLGTMLPAHVCDSLLWFKSRRSSGNGACVEIAFVSEGGMAMRDSKDPDGPVIYFSTSAWRRFVAGVRSDEIQ